MEVCRVLLEAGAEVDAANIVNKYYWFRLIVNHSHLSFISTATLA